MPKSRCRHVACTRARRFCRFKPRQVVDVRGMDKRVAQASERPCSEVLHQRDERRAERPRDAAARKRRPQHSGVGRAEQRSVLHVQQEPQPVPSEHDRRAAAGPARAARRRRSGSEAPACRAAAGVPTHPPRSARQCASQHPSRVERHRRDCNAIAGRGYVTRNGSRATASACTRARREADRLLAGPGVPATVLPSLAWTYIAVRQRVATEVTDAAARLAQAETTRAIWQKTVVDPLALQQIAAQRAFEAGDTSYLFVLETTRRLNEARLRAREIDADSPALPRRSSVRSDGPAPRPPRRAPVISSRQRWMVASIFALTACGRQEPPASTGKAATVTAPVKEAALTTIKLTPEAEKRLGITTAAVERKPFADTRDRRRNRPAVRAVVASPRRSPACCRPPRDCQSPGGRVSQGPAAVPSGPDSRRADRESPVIAQQAIDTATARRDAAARKTQRAEQLLKDGAGSRRQLEEAQAELAVAEAELKAALDRRALAARSRRRRSRRPLDAPQEGVVQAVHVKPGQTVAASAPLIDLVQVTSVWVRVPIYAGESGKSIRRRRPSAHAWRGTPMPTASLAQPIPAPPSANRGRRQASTSTTR